MKKNQIIAERINRLLKERGMSQSTLAYESGLSAQTISNIMQGHRNPNPASLKAIADVLGVYDDYLTGNLPYKDIGAWLDMLAEYDFTDNQASSIFHLLESWGYECTDAGNGFYNVVCPNGTEKILCRNHLVFLIKNFFSSFEMILLPERLFPSEIE